MPAKAELRQRFRAQRRAYPLQQIEADSQQIQEQVLNLTELTNARQILVYASTRREVQTHTLIERLLMLGKTVALPRIIDAATSTMQAAVVRFLDDLVPGDFGILTPRHHEPLAGSPDMAIVPGLAFSPATGTRLGMGGGYYDRYLAPLVPPTFIVGLAFDHQLEDHLPAETHDVPVHAIATPRRVIRPTATPD